MKGPISDFAAHCSFVIWEFSTIAAFREALPLGRAKNIRNDSPLGIGPHICIGSVTAWSFYFSAQIMACG